MNPREVQAALEARTEKIRAAVEAADTAPLLRAAQQTASMVRDIAGREGHVIAVRVVERPAGVRITVVGRQAARYRAMVQRTLDRVMPESSIEIRSQITQKAR